MAETPLPELPLVPRYRFIEGAVIYGVVNGDPVPDAQPIIREFRKGDVIAGICRSGTMDRDFGPTVEYTDENGIKYLIPSSKLEPLIESDACKPDPGAVTDPDSPSISFCLSWQCLLWYALIIILIILFIRLIKAI